MFKKLFILSLFLCSLTFAQNKVISQPRAYDWTKIFSNVTTTGSDTSEAFWLTNVNGAQTLWIEPSTVSSPGVVKVKFQLYNTTTKTWAWYYSATDTLVATIPESRLSTTMGVYVLPAISNTSLSQIWGWGSQGRFIIEPADTILIYDGYVGGQ